MFEDMYTADYWFARFLILRGLGLIYIMAFLVAINQFRPLLGEHGLLPAPLYLKRVSLRQAPSIFHLHYSDRFFIILAWSGLLLAFLAASGLSGSGPMWLSWLIWFLLWVIYLSIVNIGQLFYGFGWESLLLEAGFYAIFLAPLQFATPIIIIFVIRWLLFRVEFGAGLIKMRGDPCWRDLSCLNYHHETQPMPNPLSRFFHLLPKSLHKAETFFNHIVQLIAVWFLFFPQPVASVAALLIILSQAYLIISGNYAWLNWITVILAFSGFSDQYLQAMIPIAMPAHLMTPAYYQITVIGLGLVVVILSISPVRNMISRRQRMNASFNSLHLVNSYGAFGSVTRKRNEIVIEGTTDEVITSQTIWKAYEFKGKPGNPHKIPSQIAPYHYRLDWQLWFAAMTSIHRSPWLIRLIIKLLENDNSILALLNHNPFKDKPPSFIRARLYHYRFTTFKEWKNTGQWWSRTFEYEYLSPQSLSDLNAVG